MAKAMTAPGRFALALMKALGLPARTVSFELRCAVNEVVTVKCEYHLDESTAAGFDAQPLLSKYKLVEMNEGKAELTAQDARDKPFVPQPQPVRHGTEDDLLAAAVVLLGPVALLLLVWLVSWLRSA